MQTLADSVVRQNHNNTVNTVGSTGRPTDIFQRQALVNEATPYIPAANTAQSRDQKLLQTAEDGRMTQHREDKKHRKLKGHKLFAQEFFNIQRQKKRDLAGFSLHNHPDSFPDGMFDKFKQYDTHVNRTSGQPIVLSPRDGRLKKLQQSAIQQTRSTSIEQINKADTDKYGIGLQNHLGYGLKIDQNSGEIGLSSVQHISHDVSRTLPNIKTGLKTTTRLNQSLASMGPSQQANTANMYHGVHDFDSSSQGSFQPQAHHNNNRLSVPQIASISRVQSIPSDRQQSVSHLFTDTVISSGGGRSPRGQTLNAHHLNEKRYTKKLNMEEKLSTDFQLLKSIQRESYGANMMVSDSYTFPIDDKPYVKNVPLPKKLPAQYSISKSGRRQPLRHPGLKHELKGAPLSNSAQKLNHFAKHAPVFQNQTRTQVQDDIMKGIIQNVTKSENEGASTSHQYSENEIRNLSLEVNNIKDQAGFNRKVQGKLDELIDPKNIQIFNMKQSKQLYQVVTKYADKEKEKQRKYDEKTLHLPFANCLN